MLKFQCPFCDRKYKISESLYGKPAQCKACRNKFVLPTAEKVKAALAQQAAMASPKRPSQSQAGTKSTATTVPKPATRRVSAAASLPAAAAASGSVPTANPPATVSGSGGSVEAGYSLEQNLFDDAFFDNHSAMVADAPLANPAQFSAPAAPAAPKVKRKRRRVHQETPDEDAFAPKVGWVIWFVAAIIPLSLTDFLPFTISYPACFVTTAILGGIGGVFRMPHCKAAGIVGGIIGGCCVTPAVYYYTLYRETIFTKEIALVALVAFLPGVAVAYVLNLVLNGGYDD